MKRLYFILNVIVPLVIGATIYYLFYPDTLFVRFLDRIIGISNHVPMIIDDFVLMIIRNYLLDILWAYSLMSLTLLLFGIDKNTIITVFIFEWIMESVQLLPFLPGTFDIFDILVEMLANIFACIIYKRRDQT